MPDGLTTWVGEITPDQSAFVSSESIDAASRLAAARGQELRRLRRGGLLPLYEERRITPAELRAGQEMATVREATARHMQGGSLSARYGAAASGPGVAVGGLPLLYVERYQPWAQWARAFPVTATTSMADLVLLVAEDGLGPRQIRGIVGIGEPRMLRLLRRGLHRYARIAGWVDGDDPVTIPD